jgi:hypothetical protein
MRERRLRIMWTCSNKTTRQSWFRMPKTPTMQKYIKITLVKEGALEEKPSWVIAIAFDLLQHFPCHTPSSSTHLVYQTYESRCSSSHPCSYTAYTPMVFNTLKRPVENSPGDGVGSSEDELPEVVEDADDEEEYQDNHTTNSEIKSEIDQELEQHRKSKKQKSRASHAREPRRMNTETVFGRQCSSNTKTNLSPSILSSPPSTRP